MSMDRITGALVPMCTYTQDEGMHGAEQFAVPSEVYEAQVSGLDGLTGTVMAKLAQDVADVALTDTELHIIDVGYSLTKNVITVQYKVKSDAILPSCSGLLKNICDHLKLLGHNDIEIRVYCVVDDIVNVHTYEMSKTKRVFDYAKKKAKAGAKRIVRGVRENDPVVIGAILGGVSVIDRLANKKDERHGKRETHTDTDDSSDST
tara:strand:+ start:8575 stop:9189 length:615 start_codon:yes stop_codon:yes gene_type:complete